MLVERRAGYAPNVRADHLERLVLIVRNSRGGSKRLIDRVLLRYLAM